MLVFLWVHRRFQLDWYYSVPSFHRLSYGHSRLSSLNSLDSASYCQFLVKILFLWFLKKGKTSTPRKKLHQKRAPLLHQPRGNQRELSSIYITLFSPYVQQFLSMLLAVIGRKNQPCFQPSAISRQILFGTYEKFCLTVKPWLTVVKT